MDDHAATVFIKQEPVEETLETSLPYQDVNSSLPASLRQDDILTEVTVFEGGTSGIKQDVGEEFDCQTATTNNYYEATARNNETDKVESSELTFEDVSNVNYNGDTFGFYNISTKEESTHFEFGEVSYFCELCEYHTSCDQDYNTHLTRKHPVGSINQIQDTTTSVTSTHNAETNDEITTTDYFEETVESDLTFADIHELGSYVSFCCAVCNFTSDRKGNLRAHMTTHYVSCDLCSARSIHVEIMVQHKKIHANTKIILSCLRCTYKAVSEEDLKGHELAHKLDKNFYCKVCSFKTIWKQSLKEHMGVHCLEKNFCCNLCSYRSNQPRNLMRHLRIHGVHKKLREMVSFKTVFKATTTFPKIKMFSGAKKFYCDLCDFKTLRLHNMKKHREIHDFKCEKCNYKAQSEEDLLGHSRSHAAFKTFYCRLCPFKTNWRQSLRKHIEGHAQIDHLLQNSKKDGIEIIQSFRCIKCDYQCHSEEDLKNHHKIHFSVKKFYCRICPFKTNWRHSLKRHVETHIAEEEEKEAAEKLAEVKENFSCGKCDYKCHLDEELREHDKTHSFAKTFHCDMCNFQTNWKQSLKKHAESHALEKSTTANIQNKKTHSETEEHCCIMCDFKCHALSELKEHEKIHPSIDTYQCKLCTFKTHWKHSLKRHAESHTVEKTTNNSLQGGTEIQVEVLKYFHCNVCDYKSNLEEELQEHEKVHAAAEIFCCEICTFKTSWKHSLKRHVETHSVEKTTADTSQSKSKSKQIVQQYLSCGACDYKSLLEEDLKEHLKTTHASVETFHCTLCDFKTNWKGSLKRHVETHSSASLSLLKSEEDDEKRLDEIKNSAKISDDEGVLEEETMEDEHEKAGSVFKMLHCTMCDFKTNWKQSLKRHVETHNATDSTSLSIKKKHIGEIRLFYCSTCTYKNQSEDDVKEHEKIHCETFNCNLCEFKTKWRNSLRRHLESHAAEKASSLQSPFQKLNCSVCDYESQSEEDMKEHEKGHASNVEMYSCEVCDFKTNWKGSLKRHVETHNSTGSNGGGVSHHVKRSHHEAAAVVVVEEFSCIMCDYKTHVKEELRAHEKIHSADKIFYCKRCDFKTSWKGSLKRHVVTHSSGDGSQEKRKKIVRAQNYSCAQCHYKCDSEEDMREHERAQHSTAAVKIFHCESCDFKSTWKRSLRRHVLIHANNEDNEDNGDDNHDSQELCKKKAEFACSSCDYRCDTDADLKQHQKTTHEVKIVFYCKLCEFKTHWKQSLKKHMEGHAEEKIIPINNVATKLVRAPPLEYHCGKCAYKSFLLDDLRKHEKFHSAVKTFYCKVCDFKTNWRQSLKKHVGVHNTEQNFCCTKCNYKSNQARNLMRHLKVHEGNLKANVSLGGLNKIKATPARHKFLCNLCNFKTVDEYVLKRHVKSHLETFACSLCDFKTVWRKRLNKHMEIHESKQKKFHCSKCSYETHQEKNLKLHFKVHESKEPQNVKLSAVTANSNDVEICQADSTNSLHCDICSFATADKYSLEKHKLSHLHSKTICCAKCDYKTFRVGDLTKHMAIHTQDKNYSCNICDFKTRWRQSLTNHLKKH